MPKKTTTHELKTYVEIPVLVFYTYQPQEMDGKNSPGHPEQIDIDDIELQSADWEDREDRESSQEHTETKAVKTLEELKTRIEKEHKDALIEECWEDLEEKEGG